ncbi:transcriptional regulator [Pseudomonas taetrolens]|uniref:transcriptional regulator n=1 Tax=Pseudomonas taetrolens TaxID=47884 RepID=UPI003F966E12
MNLREYIKAIEKDELDRFAALCGTSAGQLKQVAYGNRRPSAGLSICIERESRGSVVCEQLRPDIDWAYLRSTSKSPASKAA